MTSTHDLPATSRPSALEHDTAMRLAATEYERTHQAWAELDPEDWTRATDCPGWDVHRMAAHVYGMARMVASVVEMVRQQRAAAANGSGIDALTAHQVEKYGTLSPTQLVDAIPTAGSKAVRGRRRLPGLLRARTLPERQVVDGVEESWTIGFLTDVILTRDPWMHRADLARATGRPMTLTAAHDGLLVDGVAREWAARHGRPFDLTLTGPAGGHWSEGTDGERVDMDAVEFCRVLSGRGEASGLLATQVPF